MSRHHFKVFSNITVLRRFNFDLLLQFLSPFRDYLCSKDNFRWTDNFMTFPYHELIKIIAIPDEEMPVELHTALFFVNELSSPKANEALLSRLKEENLLPLESIAKEDYALYTWMTAPEILESLHSEIKTFRSKKYERRYGKKIAWPDLSKDALIALEDELNAWFESLNKGRGVQVMLYERNGTTWFHLRHGELIKSDCALKNNGMTRRIVYRPERYDCLGYTPSTGELEIHTETKRERNAYCRFFGKFLFGDEDFFITGEDAIPYTLAPLKERGRAALICSDIDRLETSRLVELHIGLPEEDNYREIFQSETCLFDAWEKIGTRLPEEAEFVRATFQFRVTDLPRLRTLTICTPNVTIYERDFGMEQTFGQWIINRKFVQ